MSKQSREAVEIAKGYSILENGRREEAVKYFEELRSRHVSSARIWLHSAFVLDSIGKESDAIPVYQAALKLGLRGRNARDAYVCLASSLRKVGKSQEGLTRLGAVVGRFRQDVVVELFFALLASDNDRLHDAVRVLSRALLRESSEKDLGRYRDVLRRGFRTVLRVDSSRREKGRKVGKFG